ncbi:hypothetical protein HUX53_00070, partial [Actinomadura sp. BRA 177]|nr:hypothetical protein [Actinomadura sp. BRA 177]
MTLHEFRRRHPAGRFTATADSRRNSATVAVNRPSGCRRLSAVAGAQGVGLVNGGYVHDTEIIGRLPGLGPDNRLARADAAELTTTFGVVVPPPTHICPRRPSGSQTPQTTHPRR